MKKIAMLVLALCLLLSGCNSIGSGRYSSVKPHREPVNHGEQKPKPVYDYDDLTAALASLVENGEESGILSMQYGSNEEKYADFEKAVLEIRESNPFAAYSVANMGYTFDNSLGQSAVSVRISYLEDRVRGNTILRVRSAEEAHRIIAGKLDECDTNIVLYFDTAEQMDFVQFVENYALANPHTVMELPAVTVSRYPQEAQKQVVELKFVYQTSQAELRSMQHRVAPVFASAQQYVAGNWSAAEKTVRLYTFLMERYKYQVRSSVTPSYSLLLHGEGDSQAFAMVYGAMCNQAGVECQIVTGTKGGKPWVWNAVKLDGRYYYLDLLQCNQNGVFALHEADQMNEYVWDTSAYLT